MSLPGIAILTDSVSCMPKPLAEQYHITVVPLRVIFGSEQYLDGIDMSADEFYRRLQTSPIHPRTSQPPPSDFVAAYETLAQDHDQIIGITLSSKFSGTYESAVQALDLVPELAGRIHLIDSLSVWKPRTQAPGNALHLREFRLSELGHPTAGFVLLIPHYLADTEYPMAAVTALESISAATGLIFPTEQLREENRAFLAKVDDQVEGNQELQRLVGTLEARHDSYMEDNPLPSPLMDESGELPGGDTIAAELEKFLANRRDDD